jgi:hypothetical protein
MPKLVKLEVYCRLRIIGATSRRYVLIPKRATPEPGAIHLFPSLLEDLIISNPSLDDHVFKHLPHSLRKLVLDFIPDWENMLSSGDNLAYHRPASLFLLFKKLQVLAGQDGLYGVEHFCIKMGWCVTPDLLEQLCLIFPQLLTLEFEGIRYFPRAEAESDMVSGYHTCSIANCG